MSAATTRRVQKSKKSGQAAIQAQAVKAVIQILFATSRSYTIDTLREKLREFYLEEADYEKRALASLSAVEVVTALLEASPTLAAIGLQVKIINGTVQLATCRLENRNLAAFIGARSEHTSELTHPALEVEIDRMFGNVDKRHLVFVLREAEMIEEFAGEDGRLRFATTGKFLRHFGLANVGELKAALQEAEAHEASAQQSTMGFL